MVTLSTVSPDPTRGHPRPDRLLKENGQPVVRVGVTCAIEEHGGSRAVGDPDPTIAHIVSTFRFLTNPAA